jgi:hypothetical protein
MLELSRTSHPFVAIVAGDGVDKPMLEEFAARHSLQRSLRFVGAVPNERMKQLMAASDIFFLPSLWEGISLAIFEAMSAGLAIVGGDVGGQRELVTPECGILIRRSTPDREIAEYTQALIPLIADPAYARRIGTHGRTRISDHYQLSQMGDRMESLFHQARTLAADSPRPSIPPALGYELAVRGIEYLRLHDVADQLWGERERLARMVGAPDSHPAPGVAAGSSALKAVGIQPGRTVLTRILSGPNSAASDCPRAARPALEAP